MNPQNFSGQNLSGRSFKGQNLTGLNFKGVDIRGTNFKNAILKDTNFSHANAGLEPSVSTLFTILITVSCIILGFFIFLPTIFILYFFTDSHLKECGYVPNIIVLATFVVFFTITIRKGLSVAVVTTAGVVALAGVVAGAIATGGQTESLRQFMDFLTIISPIASAGAVAAAVSITGAATIAVTSTMAGVVAGTIATTAAGIAGILGAIGASKIIIHKVKWSLWTEIGAVIVAGGVIGLGCYIGWRALAGDEKHAFAYKIAIAFIAMNGTSFQGANLTDADFTQATLKNTDFRKTNLTRTCFYKSQKLNLACPGKTYLQNTKLCQVLVTGQGQNKNFDREDLRGVNFQGANLTDASFIGADLSQANLQDADLSRAKLVQTLLDGTDFTGATLTGAYIEDWNITTDTKFDGVRCEYVYMRLPTKDNPDPHRKPDNRQEVFADGEFGDFIKPIFDTLDLYHNQGVDPRAIAISFKQLAENHPDAELEIVAMEKRGQDKFLLRAKTAITADKSELSAEYFVNYNQLKNLPDREIKLLLAEKENQIRRLENMVMTALERPSFYSNVEQVGFMTNNPGGISQNVSGGQVYGGMQAAQGNNNVQTSTTYSSSEQKQNLAEAAAEIQQLLEQLSQSYPTNTMTGKMALAAEATQRIENNSTLMQKTISALRAGGTAALEQVLSHPAASFVIAALDDWSKNNP
ncbi:pentapeptide repeat-containing protein [Nostoc sp. FACHB-87]|uniref:pentapeptide repeat-containing protein n=1 Tax=Nostocaceae TaxID=1162 RepID=UPI00168543E9|nr:MULTISPECIES: pentapeptide repeat-containing protein [Nostocaceae]MBD2457697.1 pentapeptide repeat-containing protein [Nostoc sp. FACHB-87]MBD2478840.1 pentapeptide repeat-containing protein [Anabaena sp. FACHB-83]